MKDITLRISGSITIGEGDTQLHNMVRNALKDGYEIIILDLAKVTYMDSSAVGEVAASFASAKSKNCQLALSNLPPRIKKLLQIMAFLDIIPVFDSNEDALQILRRRGKK